MVLSERAAGLRGSKRNPSSLLFYRHNVHAVVFNLLNRHSLVRNFIVYWAPTSCGGLLTVVYIRLGTTKYKKTHRTILLSNKRRKPNVEKNKTPTMKTIFFKKKITKRGYLYVIFFVRIIMLCSGNFYDAEAEGL